MVRSAEVFLHGQLVCNIITNLLSLNSGLVVTLKIRFTPVFFILMSVVGLGQWLSTAYAQECSEISELTPCNNALFCIKIVKGPECNCPNPRAYQIWIQSRTHRTITAQINFNPRNMNMVVLPMGDTIKIETPGDSKVVSAEIPCGEAWASNYSCDTIKTWVDPITTNHEAVYSLPYLPGEAYMISQGADGSSHNQINVFAWDWSMDVGTQIVAARGGKVVRVRNDIMECGPSTNEGNMVWIQHEDGTIGQYEHLSAIEETVQPGTMVKRGDVIALSGDTGNSCDPHLHFQVSGQNKMGKYSIPIQFHVAGSDTPVTLEALKEYKAPDSP